MRSVHLSRKSLLIIIIAAVVVVALVLVVRLDRRSEPYSVDGAMLAGWKVVTGAASDPWVVAVEPPAALTASLFQQVSKKAGRPVVAPPHTALPLVLRKEHDDALQGVYGIADIHRMANGTFGETTRFEPVCVGHLLDRRTDSSGELFFVAFNSLEFSDLRIELQPDFPEHAGTGIYDAGALTPILPIATTDKEFERWWPIRLNQIDDCQGQIVVK